MLFNTFISLMLTNLKPSCPSSIIQIIFNSETYVGMGEIYQVIRVTYVCCCLEGQKYQLIRSYCCVRISMLIQIYHVCTQLFETMSVQGEMIGTETTRLSRKSIFSSDSSQSIVLYTQMISVTVRRISIHFYLI